LSAAPDARLTQRRSGALRVPATLQAAADAALEEAGLLLSALLKLGHVLARSPDDLGVFHVVLPSVSEHLAEEGLGDDSHEGLGRRIGPVRIREGAGRGGKHPERESGLDCEGRGLGHG